MERLKRSQIILVVYSVITAISFGLTGCHRTRTNAASQLSRGRICCDKGAYDEAISYFTKAITIDPDFIEAYIKRANIYVRTRGLYDLAIYDYTRVIEIDQRNTCAYNLRGVAHLCKGECDLAISDFTMAITLNPNYAEAYSNRGGAYLIKTDYHKAISDFNCALRISESPGIYYNRGYAHMKTGNFNLAIADYSLAISLNPNFAKAYNNRAVAYLVKKNHKKARADLIQARALGHPVNPRFIQFFSEE